MDLRCSSTVLGTAAAEAAGGIQYNPVSWARIFPSGTDTAGIAQSLCVRTRRKGCVPVLSKLAAILAWTTTICARLPAPSFTAFPTRTIGLRFQMTTTKYDADCRGGDLRSFRNWSDRPPDLQEHTLRVTAMLRLLPLRASSSMLGLPR